MIKITDKLNVQQLKDLNQLGAACRDTDGSIPNVYPYLLEQKRALPAGFLCYKKAQLVGFLSVFFFYEQAVEISVMVHPLFRRKGIGKELLSAMMPLLGTYNIKDALFTNPAKKNDSWLKPLGFSYKHSEYNMMRHDLLPILEFNQPPLVFRDATHDDVAALSELDVLCFSKKQPESIVRIKNLLDDRKYKLYAAVHDGQVIGKAHLRWDTKGVTLSDIAITPKLQGKGLGSVLIAYCVNSALSEGESHISLDVETHNLRALELYKRLGFSIQNACDYWTISAHNLAKTFG
jgi:ribosomal protein S18 acetylase RimI-like enzyme